MVDGKPLVSIGVPVYNGESYLRQALDSLLAQDYENFELIISDNASTDATQQICLEYAARDRRIRYRRNEVNLGSPKNFNGLFEASSGEYFMWAADHDYWEPSFLSRCVEVLEHDPSVVLCYPHAAWIGTDGGLLEDIPFRFDTRGLNKISRLHAVLWGLNNNYVIFGLIRSSALKQTRLHGNTIGPDTTLLTELSLLGAFAYIPELLFYLRRTHGYGSWSVQAKKLNKRVPTRWPGHYLYWELVYDHLRVIMTHSFEAVTYTERVAMALSVFIGVALKYVNILRGFPNPSKQMRAKVGSP